jgi:hypothetical protein
LGLITVFGIRWEILKADLWPQLEAQCEQGSCRQARPANAGGRTAVAHQAHSRSYPRLAGAPAASARPSYSRDAGTAHVDRRSGGSRQDDTARLLGPVRPVAGAGGVVIARIRRRRAAVLDLPAGRPASQRRRATRREPGRPGPPQIGHTDAFLPLLVRGLGELPGPVVAVLDDLHEPGDQGILAGVKFLLKHAPSQLRLVLRPAPTRPCP